MNITKIKIASPLFILRNEAQKDLFAVLEKLSALGFDGVEFLGFFGKSPREIREKLDSLSLKAVSNHVGANEFIKDPDKVINDHLEIGCGYITISWSDGSIKPGMDGFDAIIKNIGCLARLCRDKGITPLYHNHAFELLTNPPMLDIIIDSCNKDGLCLEPDLGWIMTGQADPAAYLRKYADRCPVIHVKDVYAEDFSKIGSGGDLTARKANPDAGYFEFRPTGYGLLNLPKLMPLCLKCNPEWFVVDHDASYDRNIYADLKLSLDYTRNLLAIAGDNI